MFRRRAKEETVAERWSRSADEWEEAEGSVVSDAGDPVRRESASAGLGE